MLFAATYREALDVAQAMGYTETPTWRNRGTYTTTRPSARLQTLLEPHHITPGAGQLRSLVEKAATG